MFTALILIDDQKLETKKKRSSTTKLGFKDLFFVIARGVLVDWRLLAKSLEEKRLTMEAVTVSLFGQLC